MEKLKIGISGAHSTGKSTFVRRLAGELLKRNFTVEVVGDLATKCPLPILRDHTAESSLWIATKGITEEIEASTRSQIVIADRSILDSWVYFRAAQKDQHLAQTPAVVTLRNTVQNWLGTYDLIYLTELDDNIPIADDKLRDMSPEYRRKIAEMMKLSSSEFAVAVNPLTIENIEEALEGILEKTESLPHAAGNLVFDPAFH